MSNRTLPFLLDHVNGTRTLRVQIPPDVQRGMTPAEVCGAFGCLLRRLRVVARVKAQPAQGTSGAVKNSPQGALP